MFYDMFFTQSPKVLATKGSKISCMSFAVNRLMHFEKPVSHRFSFPEPHQHDAAPQHLF
jgi:hypothetical protein